MSRPLGLAFAAAVGFASGCTGSISESGRPGQAEREPSPGPEPVAFTPGPSALRRLTPRQLANTYRDLLGVEVTLPETEEVPIAQGLRAVGASRARLSPAGVEQIESAARLTAERLVTDDVVRRRLLRCATPDPGCTRDFVIAFGRRAFRRPLSPSEIARYTDLATKVQTPAAPLAGVRAIVAAMLTSPKLLYRVELGGGGRFTGYEVATRLSYLLWNSTPDDELLDAASTGRLNDAAGIREQARRLLGSPQAREGLAAFVGDYLGLDTLATLERDRSAYPLWTPALAAAMREETERLVGDIVLERDADVRELCDAGHTFVDATLARLYGLPAVATGGFERVSTTAGGQRLGLLGHAGILALTSKPDDTSPTLRGLFVRAHLLCHEVPPPPPDVEAMFPEPPAGQVVAKRDLIIQHGTAPACAGCHRLMDPIGVGLEVFDAIGAARSTDRGLAIDARGDLDGQAFDGPRGLAMLLRNHPEAEACLTDTLFRYAVGRHEAPGEVALLARLRSEWAAGGRKLGAFLVEVAASDGFRMTSGKQ